MSNNKSFFEKTTFFNLLPRGFKILQNSFISSYMAQLLSFVIIGALGAGVYYILYNLWKGIEPPTDPDDIPYRLLYISLGIMVAYTFVSYMINTIASAVIYHSNARSLINKGMSLSSFAYAFKNILNWFLLSLIVIIGSLAYFVTAGMIAYYLGSTGQIAAVVMGIVYLLAMLIFTPVLSLVIPFMVIEKKNIFQAIARAFGLGFRNYWQAFGIEFINYSLLFFFTNMFIILFFVFQSGMHLSLGFYSTIHTMFSLSIFWIILGVYVSVISMILVIKSSVLTAYCASIMNTDMTSDEAYDKVSKAVK